MKNKLIILALSILFLSVPSAAFADDVASTTPDEPVATSTPNDVAPEVATSTDVVPAPSDSPVPLPVAIPITLDIETQTGTLFKESLTVAPCVSSPDSATQSVTAYCAVQQSGVAQTWSWYGNDAFVDSLGGVSNDYSTNAYWDWFSDLSFGTNALNAHELHAGESVLITIGRMPLRVSVTPNTLTAQASSTVSVQEFGFDSSFNPVWEAAASSTVTINGEPYGTDESGTFAYVPTTEGNVTITATKEGHLDAPLVTSVVTASQNPDPITIDTHGTGGGRNTHDPIVDARNFLLQFQNPDGSFPSSLLTDWSALALASGHASTVSLTNYLRSANDPLTSATDFERRTMALEALGVDPAKIAHEIASRFDGTQIGDKSLVNDDMFGIIALTHAGYTTHDEIIQKSAAFLISKQDSNGSWGNIDLTAASIQALSPLTALPNVSSAISHARSYLMTHEQTDGCFGNSFTTSWALMAITALGESPDAWHSSNGASPLDCLRTLQASDGGFEEGADSDTRTWATAYALPALMGDSWNTVLGWYSRPATEVIAPIVVAVTATTTMPEVTATTTAIVPVLPSAQATTTPTRPSELHRTVTTPMEHSLAAAAVLALEPSVAPQQHPDAWSFVLKLIESFFRLLHIR